MGRKKRDRKKKGNRLGGKGNVQRKDQVGIGDTPPAPSEEIHLRIVHANIAQANVWPPIAQEVDTIVIQPSEMTNRSQATLPISGTRQGNTLSPTTYNLRKQITAAQFHNYQGNEDSDEDEPPALDDRPYDSTDEEDTAYHRHAPATTPSAPNDPTKASF